jgi:glycosyltransferase involved in cell wall biosynthesis
MQTAMLRQANPDLPSSKFITIPNGYDDAEWTAAPLESTESVPVCNNKFVITYAGNLYHGRSPYPLFRALHSLIETGQIARDQIRIELLGACDVAEGTRVSDVAATLGLCDCLNTPGLLSRNEAVQRMKESNLLLLLVDEQSYSIPAKTYEYLRAGRPILALTAGGAVVDLLNRTGGAWVIDPADNAGIAAALIEAYLGWKSGVDARLPDVGVVGSYDRRLLAGGLAEVFQSAFLSAHSHSSLRNVAATVRSNSSR